MGCEKILVCETSQRWTVALRWGLAGDDSHLVVADHLEHCWALLKESPASFLALELNETNLESTVERLQDLRHRFPQARAAVMCDRALDCCQWLVREAGAVHVAVSIREVATLIRLAQRHFEQVQRPAVGFRQGVWDRLPWPTHGT